MEKLTEAMVKAIDRSNPFMQNLQLASRFNKLVDDLEDNHEVEITENGEIEIIPTVGKYGMKKVTANVAVPTPILEENKTTIIDVSSYTDSVEVIPTEGKDGMKKNTVTLSNIPQAGATLYAWKNTTDILYTKVETPTTSDKALIGASTGISEEVISAVGEGTITVDNVEYARDTDSDLEL